MNRSKNRYKRVKWLFGKEIEIPEDWEIKKLGAIGDIISGGTPDSTNAKYWNGGILWAVPTDITKLSTLYIDDTERKITKDGLENSSAKLLPVGTILVTSRATIGKCAIATKPMATNQGFQNIICDDNFDCRFIFYAIKHDSNSLLHLAYGTTFLEISKAAIKNVAILVPKKNTQTKIASILSSVDAAIVSTQKVIEKTEELKKGLMQKLLTRGIGHTKFKKVKWHFGKEIEIPEDWKIEKLEENSTLKGRIGWQGLTTAEYQETGGYYLVTGTDFKNGKIDWKNCVYVNKIRYVQDQNIQLKNEDVLVTKDGTIGKVAYIFTMTKPATLNSGIFVIRPIDMKYSSLFLFYILNSFYFFKFLNRLQAGSTINHLYQKDFVNFQFPLPNLHEQNKIASILSEIGAYIQKNQECKKKLEQLKKGLMQKLLTGQIRIKIDH